MGKVGRPAKNSWGKNKSRDPNRRKIMNMPNKNILKGLTEDEKKAYRKDQHKEYLQRLKEKEQSLEYLKEPTTLLKYDTEPYNEFLKRVRKKNSDRLTEILNDPELMWEIFADRDDIRTVEIAVLREKKRENKEYISDAEVQKVMERIYGGYSGQVIEEEEESEYRNPYETNE
jgi:hypothetical protein